MVPEATPDLRAFRDFEEEGWNRNAIDYAGAFGRATDQFIELLLDAAQVTSATRLLDLACGPGNLAAAAAARGADVVGVDIAKEMVAVAKRRNPAILFHRAPAEELPFGDRSLDAVCAGFAMHHFPDPAGAAVEVFRVPWTAIAEVLVPRTYAATPCSQYPAIQIRISSSTILQRQ